MATERSEAGVTVRHYCQGIGDCHLLKLKQNNGDDFWVLIDCGVHSSITGGTEKIAQIVQDIAERTNKRLDVVVVTHEHWDHVSGFLTEAEQFKGFSVGEVWMPWTEDPKDPQARELDKFKQESLNALQRTRSELKSAVGLSPYLEALHQGLDSVLGFNFGAKGERVRDARDAAAALVAQVRYFEPKKSPIPIPELPGLRIHVLGPPRDAKLLGITESADEMYGFGGPGSSPIVRALSHPLGKPGPEVDDPSAPFDPIVGIELSSLLDAGTDSHSLESKTAALLRDHYSGPLKKKPTTPGGSPDPHETDQSWRRIDKDWLGVSADLAMQLDDRTNNTSLVLAFEFIGTGRVLLFAADAQIGNWMSWRTLEWSVDGNRVTGPDLLARVVYYKVGHHGSHNATPKGNGLELMTSRDLSAFIPTNEKDAKKVKWGQMPFPGILERLKERCSGRVIRADDPWITMANARPGFDLPSGSIRAVSNKPGLWVELDIA